MQNEDWNKTLLIIATEKEFRPLIFISIKLQRC